MAQEREPRYLSLAQLVRFLIVTLTRWAAAKQYGEIRIVVQGGQIEFVHENLSHRGGLPQRNNWEGSELADRAVETLTAKA